MTSKPAIIFTITAVLFGSVLLLYMIPAEILVPQNRGSIEHAGDSTKLKLRKYELTGWTYEIRNWLTGSHDGAHGQQIAYVFLQWGVQHPDDFTSIVEGVDAEDRPELILWLGIMVHEAMIDRDFLEVFDRYHSPVITALKLEVAKRKKQ